MSDSKTGVAPEPKVLIPMPVSYLKRLQSIQTNVPLRCTCIGICSIRVFTYTIPTIIDYHGVVVVLLRAHYKHTKSSLLLKSFISGSTVMFNDHSSYSGDEADSVIAVTIVATGVSSVPYNVTITPSELVPVSAREVFDYSNDTIVVTFNPGETEKTAFIVINQDCIREGSEYFNLTLSLDSVAMGLGITLGDPSVAVAEIEDTDGKQRLFSY